MICNSYIIQINYVYIVLFIEMPCIRLSFFLPLSECGHARRHHLELRGHETNLKLSTMLSLLPLSIHIFNKNRTESPLYLSLMEIHTHTPCQFIQSPTHHSTHPDTCLDIYIINISPLRICYIYTNIIS